MLARELSRWRTTTALPGEDPSLYLLAQMMWTRLHGIVSLEIEGVYAQMALDPGARFGHEVRALLDPVGA